MRSSRIRGFKAAPTAALALLAGLLSLAALLLPLDSPSAPPEDGSGGPGTGRAPAARRDSPGAPRPEESGRLVYRLAELHPLDHPTTRGDYEFARLVGLRTDGRVRIEVYPESRLGQEVAVLEQVRFGGIDLARVSLSALSVFHPALNALQMPYLYRDAEHMWRVLGGPIGKEILAGLEGSGFTGIGWFDAGARSFYTTAKPVRRPEDLEGLRVRVMENRLMSGMASRFGAIPVPQPFGEVYSALVSGAIDGAENNLASFYTSGHHLVARWFTRDGHSRVPEIIVAAAATAAELGPGGIEALRAAAAEALAFQRRAWADYEEFAAARVREAGVTIIDVPDPGPWRDLVGELYAAQAPAIREMVRRIREVE